MIILPDRSIPRSKILLPMRSREWRTPSQAQEKNSFGHENLTRFSVTARINDGHIVWRGWFDDRDDFDAFLWSMATGSLRWDREIQRLPTPWWNPDLDGDFPNLSYEFVTLSFITSGTSWNVPSDCTGVSGQSGEFIDAIGAGGSGGAARQSGLQRASGGAGGAFSRITSLSLTPGGSVTVQIGTPGAQVSTGFGAVVGNLGTDSWFNGASLAASSVGAKGGPGGDAQAGANATGASGGAASSGVGTTKYSGGGSATASNTGGASGAGGAAGPSGNGNSSSAPGFSAGSAGGSGDNGSGGSSGSAGAPTGGAGGNGTEYDASHGSGGGGGGAVSSGATGATGGAAGAYGAGSGAASGTSGTSTALIAGAGLVTVSYVPLSLMGQIVM